jgi:hypothetical protein
MPPPPKLDLSLDAVIVAVTGDEPRVLALAGERDALPSGLLDAEKHVTLERGLREWVLRQTGHELGYVEQLYTFGDRFRDKREGAATRVVSAAYLALVREESFAPHPGARFRNIYDFLPWEDWRGGVPAVLERELKPLLAAWVGSDKRRRERVDLSFGLQGAPWDAERTLERYELLWEAGIVVEAG